MFSFKTCKNLLRSVFLTIFLLYRFFPASSLLAEEQFKPEFNISGPYNHENLSIYLLHGADAKEAQHILTIGEALKAKKLRVDETGDVNELVVENLSKSEIIFIQAGDIVKGGRQDRTLGEDLTLLPRSGKIKISAFCVEHGRWHERSAGSGSKFDSSETRVNSKELKRAVMADREQGKVWDEVENVQKNLGTTLGSSVQDEKSQTSLQLSLENKNLKARSDEYKNKLANLAQEHSDARGYLFVINGAINAGDVYVSHALFAKRWPQLLESSANEALTKYSSNETKDVSREEVQKFIVSAEAGTVKQKLNRGDSVSVLKESNEANVYEGRNSANGEWLHKSYLAK